MLLLRPPVGLITRPWAVEEPPPDPPTIAWDYTVVTDQGSVGTQYANAFTVPTPVAGQKFMFMAFSEEPLSGTPLLGGSTTGVTVHETDTYSTDIVTTFQLDGWEVGTSLNVEINFGGTNTFFVLHGWQTVGLDYVPNSLVSGTQAASNQTATVLAFAKSLNDVAFMGTRKYSSITGSPSPTQDFGTSSAWAGHLLETDVFSGNLTANATVTSTLKFAGAFLTTPSAP